MDLQRRLIRLKKRMLSLKIQRIMSSRIYKTMIFGSKSAACTRHSYPPLVIITAAESEICDDITEVDSSSVVRRHEEIL